MLENIALLSPAPTSFQDRYGQLLTPTTFAKPGNTAEANSVLHFLLLHIEPDLVEPMFKPCFPIRDREQERDFRRVVDSRLAVLEKSKLLPVGASRKTVVASAGGDRFLDLLWSLSSLALQQACMRHPSYGPVSRLRMVPVQPPRADTLSHQSSIRSNRTLLSVVSSRSERNHADPHTSSRQRRFLGVGLLSASQQRSRHAEQIRARIDAERHALERTTDLAKKGATTWASEAYSLREKIGHFEGKLARLKGQLTDMGFDENGNDIRSSPPSDHRRSTTVPALAPSSTLATTVPPVSTPTTHEASEPRLAASSPTPPPPTALTASSSRDDLADELKTSPIDSTESGSSVDELPEPHDRACDIAADLSRLLSFTAVTREIRERVDHSLETEKPKVDIVVDRDVPAAASAAVGAPGRVSEAADIVDLVRVATSQLEEATNRMDEIREERRKAGEDVSSFQVRADAKHPKAGAIGPGSDLETTTSLVSVPEENESKEEPILADPFMCNEGNGGDTTNSINGSDASDPIAPASVSTPVLVKEEVVEDGDVLEKKGVVSDVTSDEFQEERGGTVVVKSEDTQEKAKDSTSSLEKVATEMLDRHLGVVKASEQLRKEAVALTKKADVEVMRVDKIAKGMKRSASADVTTSMDAEWLATAIETVSGAATEREEAVDVDNKAGSNGVSESAKDLQVAAKAMRHSGGDRKSREEAMALRRKKAKATRSLDSINLSTGSEKTVDLCPRYDTDVSCSGPIVSHVGSKVSRSVRFAELPPSYSRSRGGSVGAHVADRLARCATPHPRSRTGDVNVGGVEDKRFSRRAEGAAKQAEGAVGVSGHKPPRLQRRQTPHRITRQKDVIQRGVAPAAAKGGRVVSNGRPVRIEVASGGGGVEAEVVAANKEKEAVVEEERKEVVGSVERIERVLESAVVDDVVSDAEKFDAVVVTETMIEHVQVSAIVEKEIGSEAGDSIVGEVTKVIEKEVPQEEKSSGAGSVVEKVVRKVSNININNNNSKNDNKGESQRSGGRSGKKSGIMRISSGMLSGIGGGKGRSLSMSSRDSHHDVRDCASVSGGEDFGSRSEHGGSKGVGGGRSSGGFFAGEAAQWQENVRLAGQDKDSGVFAGDSESRFSSERGLRNGRGHGRQSNVSRSSVFGASRSSASGANGAGGGGTAPVRRSRMQGFRERLAALKGE